MGTSLNDRNMRLFTILIMMIAVFGVNGQSAKKYFKNGFYEEAFYKSVKKQNRKVKLKPKWATIIQQSYDSIYVNHSSLIQSYDLDWERSYQNYIRLSRFKEQVNHPKVYERLKSLEYDRVINEAMAEKFNVENQSDIDMASGVEVQGDFHQALNYYQQIGRRHKQVETIGTLNNRLIFYDYQAFIDEANQNIGDDLIKEAMDLMEKSTEQRANQALRLIEQARQYRPLSFEEEELIKLVQLMKGDSWMTEAKKLIATRTKPNARLAFELIRKTNQIRPLTSEEQSLLERAKTTGTTNVLVKSAQPKGIHSSEAIAGHLNQSNQSIWVNYHSNQQSGVKYDYEVELQSSNPKVALGKVDKKVSQSTRTVEYYEDEINAQGQTVKVKKTRLAIGMVAVLSQTKSAEIKWKLIVRSSTNVQPISSVQKTSRIEYVNQFASLVSGDVLSLPENIETDVKLESQPFPSNNELSAQVKSLFLNDLNNSLNQVIH